MDAGFADADAIGDVGIAKGAIAPLPHQYLGNIKDLLGRLGCHLLSLPFSR